MSKEILGKDPSTGKFSSPPEKGPNGSEDLLGTSDNPRNKEKVFKELDEMPGGAKNPEEILLEKEEVAINEDVEKPNLGSGVPLSVSDYRLEKGYKKDGVDKDHYTEHDELGEELKLGGLEQDLIHRRKEKFRNANPSYRNFGRKPKGKQEKGGVGMKVEANKGLESDASLDDKDDLEDAA